jgi:ATP-dependent helicase/DNAse subunit B
MPPAVTIVAGPAASGKTQTLLARYRAVLAGRSTADDDEPAASPRLGNALWIAPTERAAAEVRQRLMSGELTTCFAPNVMTFERFAQAILDASPDLVRPLSPMARRQLIRRVADEQLAAGRLSYFAGIAGTPGFVDLVAAFLSEFKRSEIWPDDFSAACQAGGMSAKDRELHSIYAAYQADLTRGNLFDAEGRFWSARTLLQQGFAGPFDRLQLVVVDGFTDFSWTQLEILQLLSTRVAELFVSLPLEAGGDRGDLFAKSTSTLAQLRNRMPHAEICWTPRRAASDWPAMDRIEAELFGDPRRRLPPLADEADQHAATGVEIIAAPGHLGEWRLVADRIKELLLSGAAAPQDIAVVVRSVSDVAQRVREVFADYGIPLAIDERPALGASPLLSCLAQLLELDASDWPFRQALAVLGNSYVHPAAFASRRDTIRTAIDRALRSLQIPSGRGKLCARLRGLADRHPSAPDGESRRSATASAALALPFIEQIVATLDALPERATPIVWATALEQMATRLGMLEVAATALPPVAAAAQPAEQPVPNADLLAWERFLGALRSAGRLAEWLGAGEVQWTRREMLDQVRELLQIEPIPLPLDETGRVRVLGAQSVRALDVPYLFVANLAEQAFPRRDREDVLYHDAERGRLIDAGLRIARRADRAGEEMLLFYEVVTRATRRLTLSYPAMNDKAETLLPSPFLLEVERLVGGAATKRSSAIDLRPLPRSTAGYTRGDARLLAMQDALAGDEQRFARQLSEPAMVASANLVAALRTADSRRKTPEYGANEGMFASAAAKQRLAERFGKDVVWSATLLEGYGLCPMQFFLRHLLKLEAPRDLTLESDYLQRGGLMHAALAATHRAINDHGGRPSSPVEFAAEFSRGFAEQLTALVEQTRSDSAIDAALLELDVQLLAELVDQYLTQHASYDRGAGNLRPAHFEVAFGPQRVADPAADALSKEDPLILHLDGESLRFSGRIDRIDLEQAADGSVHFRLIDYKSGKGATARVLAERAASGRQLQLDLYTLAVEEVLLADRRAVGREIGYWHVQGKGYQTWQTLHDEQDHTWQANAVWLERKRRVLDLVFAFVRGIRDGQFPVHSCDDECTSYCDFRTMCRVNQARSLEKQWQPPAQNPTAPR